MSPLNDQASTPNDDVQTERDKDIRAIIEETCHRLENWGDQQKHTELAGRFYTSGSRLIGESGPPYRQQMDYLLCEQGLLAHSGSSLDAASFFTERLGRHLSPWMKTLLDNYCRSDIDSPPEFYSIDDTELDGLEHQAKLLYLLLGDATTDSGRDDIICTLPQNSGRFTAILLAALQVLTEELGSVLFVCNSPKAALVLFRRISSFLKQTGWTRGLTLECLFEATELDDPQIQCKRLAWNDRDQEFVRHGEQQLLSNLVLATPEYLEQHMLQRHNTYEHFLADVQLVVLADADDYFGTYGTHVSMILRRLRRLLARYGAHYKTVTTIAPHINATAHIGELWGFDSDRDVLRKSAVIDAGQDWRSRPERMVATWSAPMHFTGQPGATVNDLELKRLTVHEGLMAALGSIAYVLGSTAPTQGDRDADPEIPDDRAYRILVLARDHTLTSDDLHNLQFGGYRIDVVNSVSEIDECDRFDYRAILVYGYSGGWPNLKHEIAHLGCRHALIIIHIGSDPLSRYLIRNADNDLHPELGAAQNAEVRAQPGRNISSPGPKRLVLSPDTPRILELHLLLAAGEPGGITENEVERFFGVSGRKAIRELSQSPSVSVERERKGNARTTEHLYSAVTDTVTWDPFCVSWDTGPLDHLIPLIPRGHGGRPLGYVEKKTILNRVPVGDQGDHVAERLLWVRQGRRIQALRIRNDQIEVQYAQNTMASAYPVSSLKVEVDEIISSGGFSLGTGIDCDRALARVTITENVLGHLRVTGYCQMGDRRTCESLDDNPLGGDYQTQALLLRLKLSKDERTRLGLGVDEMQKKFLHSLCHVIRIALNHHFTLREEELEVRLFATDAEPGPDGPWDLILYDRHPKGTCYSSILYALRGEAWRDILETAYDILKSCPCADGCDQCLRIFECRAPDSASESLCNNGDLAKEPLFDFLGHMLEADKEFSCVSVLKFGKAYNFNIAQEENVVLPYINATGRRVVKVLQDKCAFFIPAGTEEKRLRAVVQFDDHSPHPGYYVGGAKHNIGVWRPTKRNPPLLERDYVLILAHEYTHNWQEVSGDYNSDKLNYYEFNNIEDPENIPFCGGLFLEGLARWAEVHVADYFGLSKYMTTVKEAWDSFSQYEAGYKVVLHLEFHTDFARLLHFLKTGEIWYDCDDGKWRKLTNARMYETYLYPNKRLNILQSLCGVLEPGQDVNGYDQSSKTPPPTNAKGPACLLFYDDYPHYEREMESGLKGQDSPRGTYLNSDPDTAEFREELCEQHGFTQAFLNRPVGKTIDTMTHLAESIDQLQHDKQSSDNESEADASVPQNNPEDPQSLERLQMGHFLKCKLQLQCDKCDWANPETYDKFRDKQGNIRPDVNASDAPRRECSLFDACHMHSCGAPGRSTTELLQAFKTKLNEYKRKKTAAENGEAVEALEPESTPEKHEVNKAGPEAGTQPGAESEVVDGCEDGPDGEEAASDDDAATDDTAVPAQDDPRPKNPSFWGKLKRIFSKKKRS